MNTTKHPRAERSAPVRVLARHAVGAGDIGLKSDPDTAPQPDLLSALWDILSTESGVPNPEFPKLMKGR